MLRVVENRFFLECDDFGSVELFLLNVKWHLEPRIHGELLHKLIPSPNVRMSPYVLINTVCTTSRPLNLGLERRPC